MQSHDPSTPAAPKPQRSSLSRYVFTLVLLVLIVGGIAWLAQYLPTGGRKDTTKTPPAPDKRMLAFSRVVAQWGDKTEDDQKPLPKDFETGTSGHYDFPFKSIYGQASEIVLYASTCDCSSVKACVLSSEEWERVNQAQTEKPGEALVYTKEPDWVSLAVDRKGVDLAQSPKVVVKADEGGIVRVEWKAKKAAGQELNLKPMVLVQATGDPGQQGWQMLIVPVQIKQPIQFDPPRVNVGEPTSTTPASASFHVWSSTREDLDFELAPTPANPLFVFDAKKLPKKDCADLERSLAIKKITARVLTAYLVTVTVHESKAGKQLYQGPFFEKWPFKVDGRFEPDAPLYGPEIVGVVKGDIKIGGTDDHGKIRFKAFTKQEGGFADVILAADAQMDLKLSSYKPSWINVKLTRDKQSSGNWALEVAVNPNERNARSFDEEDAVVLQIVGTERFVRIPLEGHISGQ